MGHTYVGLYKGWVRVHVRAIQWPRLAQAANICGSGKIQSPPNIVIFCSSNWGYDTFTAISLSGTVDSKPLNFWINAMTMEYQAH